MGSSSSPIFGVKNKKYLKPSPRITNTTSLSQTPNPFPTPIFFPFSQTNVRLFGAPELYSNRIFNHKVFQLHPFFSGSWDSIESRHHHPIIIFWRTFPTEKIQFVSQRKTTSIRTPPLRLPPIFRNSQPENVSGIPLKPQACAFRLKVPTSKKIESHLWFHCDFCTSSQK